ncbi:hypothetical protein pb186bvf_014149 [Paramecium bursaria]
MIYDLLQENLKSVILGTEQKVVEFNLYLVEKGLFKDTLDVFYSVNVAADHLHIQEYAFDYEHDGAKVTKIVLDCTKFNDKKERLIIDLQFQKDAKIPSILVKRAQVAKQAQNPPLQPHDLYTHHQKQKLIEDTRLMNLARSQLVAKFNEQPEKPQKQPKKTKEGLPTKKAKTQQKQIIKVEADVLKLTQKLEIPQDWTEVAENFSKSRPRLWDAKQYEKLLLLCQSISKKNFFKYASGQNMNPDLKKDLARFVFPPDPKDEAIKKRRKVYSKDVVLAFME